MTESEGELLWWKCIAWISGVSLLIVVLGTKANAQETTLMPQPRESSQVHYQTLDQAERNKGRCEVYKDLAGGFNVICGKARQLSWVTEE